MAGGQIVRGRRRGSAAASRAGPSGPVPIEVIRSAHVPGPGCSPSPRHTEHGVRAHFLRPAAPSGRHTRGTGTWHRRTSAVAVLLIGLGGIGLVGCSNSSESGVGSQSPPTTSRRAHHQRHLLQRPDRPDHGTGQTGQDRSGRHLHPWRLVDRRRSGYRWLHHQRDRSSAQRGRVRGGQRELSSGPGCTLAGTDRRCEVRRALSAGVRQGSAHRPGAHRDLGSQRRRAPGCTVGDGWSVGRMGQGSLPRSTRARSKRSSTCPGQRIS